MEAVSSDMLFLRATDDELREAGFDPQWIAPHEGEEGPFAPVRIFGLTCGCCGGSTSGWTVVNLETATGISTDWTHDEAETEADEHASMLNGAWLQGRRGRK